MWPGFYTTIAHSLRNTMAVQNCERNRLRRCRTGVGLATTTSMTTLYTASQWHTPIIHTRNASYLLTQRRPIGRKRKLHVNTRRSPIFDNGSQAQYGINFQSTVDWHSNKKIKLKKMMTIFALLSRRRHL